MTHSVARRRGVSPWSHNKTTRTLHKHNGSPEGESASKSCQIYPGSRLWDTWMATTHWQQLWILLASPAWNRGRIGTRRGSGTRTNAKDRAVTIDQSRRQRTRASTSFWNKTTPPRLCYTLGQGHNNNQQKQNTTRALKSKQQKVINSLQTAFATKQCAYVCISLSTTRLQLTSSSV